MPSAFELSFIRSRSNFKRSTFSFLVRKRISFVQFFPSNLSLPCKSKCSLAKINVVHFLHYSFQVGLFICSSHKFGPLRNSIVFLCIQLTTRSIFKNFQKKSDYKVQFGGAFELTEHMIQSFVEQRVFER